MEGGRAPAQYGGGRSPVDPSTITWPSQAASTSSPERDLNPGFDQRQFRLPGLFSMRFPPDGELDRRRLKHVVTNFFGAQTRAEGTSDVNI